MRFQPLATLFTLIGVAILCSLGTWQIQRLDWKTTLINDLNAAYAAPSDEAMDFTVDSQFLAGAVTGKVLTEKILHVGPRTLNGAVGYHLIAPMILKSGETLLVNFGWSADKDRLEFEKDFAGKTLTLSGLARKPDWSKFSSPNSPENDQWFRLDIQDITTAKNLSGTLPFIFYAFDIEPELSDAFPNNQKWYPYNKHKQYAIFWFTMVGVLVVIYALRFLKKPN